MTATKLTEQTTASRRRLIFAALLLLLFIASLDQTIEDSSNCPGW